MPFSPIHIPGGHLRHPECTVAVRRRDGMEYVDFRFSHGLLQTLGWRRGKAILAAADFQARQLLLTEAERVDPDSRVLQFEGGRQLRVRYPRLGAFAALVPLLSKRSPVVVVEKGPGRLVIGLRSLAA